MDFQSGTSAWALGRLSCRSVLVVLLLAIAPKVDGATFNIANADVFTLQNVITTCNSNGQDDTINLAAGGTYVISSVYTPSGGLTDDGLPAIGEANHSITINGNGAAIYRSTSQGVANFRIFEFINGSATVTNLTIDNGSVSGAGGGIRNNIPLTVTNCLFRNNSANGGAGIDNEAGATLVVLSCAFDHNSNNAVQNTNASATLSNCTFVDVNLHGQTIATIHHSALTTVTNCTLTGAALGIYVKDGAVANVGGTILDTSTSVFIDNFESSFIAAINSSGFNLTSDAGTVCSGCGTVFFQPTDQVNTDPKLDPAGLQYNGGPTPTIALTYGSPAIDRGKSFATNVDQRGVARPYDNPSIQNAAGGDGSDIGAYEAPQDPIQSGATNSPMVVNTTSDHNDGACTGSDCTLREAVARANNLPIISTITFAPNITGSIQFQNGDGPIVVTNSMNINGPGARVLAINGLTQARVFQFDFGSSTISGLTITGGFNAAASGTAATGYAGGILNQATLILNDCAVTENVVLGGPAGGAGQNGGFGQGGGVYNTGTLTLNRCLFQHNQAIGGAGSANLTQFGTGGTGGEADGAGIFNSPTGELVMSNCTLFNNEADGGAGANGGNVGGNGGPASGAIFNRGSATMVADTISGNPAFGGNGGAGSRTINHGVNGIPKSGIVAGAGTTSLTNTICAANSASGFTAEYDVEGSFTSRGYNLIGTADNGTGFTAAGDQVGTNSAKLNPLLGPLQNNGGSTNTMMPLRGSPALDAGQSASLSVDQRNQPRPVDTFWPNASGGDGSDIGAVELNLLGGPDSDGDGMSDDFEIFFGFNPDNPADGAADSDGDGLTNVQEFRLGINPLDPTSRFGATGVGKAGNDFSVAFATALSGKMYRLERKDVLDNNPATWSNIPGLPDFTATSTGPASIQDTGGANTTKRFYRVRVLP